MNIVEVASKKTIREFLNVARVIYKGDSEWVCPLDLQIESIFNPEKNIMFNNGKAKRWILKDDLGNLIGRIAAFFNKDKAYGFKQPTGGIGFFECINDKSASILLFSTAKKWLEKEGMEAVDGPINFGENENFWGLLVEGFTQPVFGMQYNKPYYKELFENYGFTFYYEQVSNMLDMRKPFPKRFWKIAGWVAKKKEYHFEHFSLKNKDKYIKDIMEIYNEAWTFHENNTPLRHNDLTEKLNDLKPFLVEDFIWFAYHNEEPIAFLVMVPDINHVLAKFNGKLGFWNKLRMLYYIKKRIITRARIVIMGVKPKYQKSGIESAIFWHMDKMMKQYPKYDSIELSWVGDFNPKMRALHQSVGASFVRKHITYRKIFNVDQVAERSIIIPRDTKEKYVNKQ